MLYENKINILHCRSGKCSSHIYFAGLKLLKVISSEHTFLPILIAHKIRLLVISATNGRNIQLILSRDTALRLLLQKPNRNSSTKKAKTLGKFRQLK